MEIHPTRPNHHVHAANPQESVAEITPGAVQSKDFFSLSFRVDVDAADEKGAHLYARLPGKWSHIGFPVRECTFERSSESGMIKARPIDLFEHSYKPVFVSPSAQSIYKAIEDESRHRDFKKNHLEQILV